MTLTLERNPVSQTNRREYAIEAVQLSKTYGPVRAVDGVDLLVERGQVYALLGPNGAGKTTTINMLTTLTLPSGGSARIAGFDVVQEAAEVRRQIGVTFQETVMDKSLSGRTLLDIHGRLYKMSKAEIKARTAELVRLVELEEAIDRPVKTYSGGMKRRLELARGLMTNPQVLFLDEPTLGLDPHNREGIWTYIEYLKREKGLTLLLTTHYMDEAEKLADRVGIINEGKIVVEGSPAELIGALGADVVNVTGSGETGRFLEALRERSWVSFADVPQEPKRDGESITENAEGSGAANSEVEQTVQVGLKIEAGRSLKPLVDLAEECGFAVADMAIKRPGLSEVFFKYTGKRLRD